MKANIEELEKISKEIRKDIIEEVYSNQSGHPGGSLSIADILTVLYFYEMNINPENPVINTRSFGEDPIQVADKVIAYASGLESGGVLSVCKHL